MILTMDGPSAAAELSALDEDPELFFPIGNTTAKSKRFTDRHGEGGRHGE
jgi:hypothetical protein